VTLDWKALAAKNIREGRVSGVAITPVGNRRIDFEDGGPSLYTKSDVDLVHRLHGAANRVHAEDHANDCE